MLLKWARGGAGRVQTGFMPPVSPSAEVHAELQAAIERLLCATGARRCGWGGDGVTSAMGALLLCCMRTPDAALQLERLRSEEGYSDARIVAEAEGLGLAFSAFTDGEGQCYLVVFFNKQTYNHISVASSPVTTTSHIARRARHQVRQLQHRCS